MDKLTRFSVSLPSSLLDDFDRTLGARGYKTRSDAMRQVIRRFIAESFWEEGEKNLFGTVTLTYDHHSHDSAREITSLQHEFGDLIICTTHIHADYQHCFESVVFKGKAARVRDFIKEISGLKDVQSSEPAISFIP